MINIGITFVVIARNEQQYIALCIESLLALPASNKQIILVDSHSTDETRSIMARYAANEPCIEVVESNAKGPAAARNCGLRRAHNDFVFFIDGDVEIQPDFLAPAMDEFSHNPTTCALAGMLAEVIYTDDYSTVVKRVNSRYQRTSRKPVKRFGGIFMVRRCVTTEVGLWDEALICHEDTDYAIRMQQFGTLMAIPVPMGTHHTVAYEKRMAALLQSGHFKGIGHLFRKNLLRPLVCLGLMLRFRFLYPAYAIFIMLVFAVVFDVRWFYAVALVPAADLLNGLRAKKALGARLMAHYLTPLQVLAGMLGAKIK